MIANYIISVDFDDFIKVHKIVSDSEIELIDVAKSSMKGSTKILSYFFDEFSDEIKNKKHLYATINTLVEDQFIHIRIGFDTNTNKNNSNMELFYTQKMQTHSNQFIEIVND